MYNMEIEVPSTFIRKKSQFSNIQSSKFNTGF